MATVIWASTQDQRDRIVWPAVTRQVPLLGQFKSRKIMPPRRWWSLTQFPRDLSWIWNAQTGSVVLKRALRSSAYESLDWRLPVEDTLQHQHFYLGTSIFRRHATTHGSRHTDLDIGKHSALSCILRISHHRSPWSPTSFRIAAIKRRT